MNRVQSLMGVCSIHSATERRLVTCHVICGKNGKYFVVYL